MRPTVLVACDSADPAPAAFARLVAPLLDARVALVNVRATESLTGTEADDVPPPLSRDVRVLHAASPAAGLQRLIAAERPVLTVLGSSHGTGHGRVRLGGTAERVLHGAARAIAVVPHGHGERTLGTIGVGLLPSADSFRALHAAAALARAASVPLLVITVLRRSPDAADAAALAARLAPAVAAQAGTSAAAILRAAIEAAALAAGEGDDFAPPRDPFAPRDPAAPRDSAPPRDPFAPRDPAAPRDSAPPRDPRASSPQRATLASGGLVVEPLVLVGDPADALLRATARLGLLVLGSRAYGPPGIVLPGGAARRVLAGARCPVLLVPRAEIPAAVPVPA